MTPRNPTPEVLVQSALLSLTAALLFVVLFRLNDFLFSFLQHAPGVNWVFLPGGFRVMLVLILGLPGAFGIAVGTLWLNLQGQELLPTGQMVLTCLASGFSPWFVKVWMHKRHQLDSDLQKLSAVTLLHFVALYAVLNAISHQSIRWFFIGTQSRIWLDVWPMFIGDVIGAVVVLYALKLSLPSLRRLLQKSVN